MKDNCSFISNNEVKSFIKRPNIFKYLKNSIDNNGFIFLQKTHSSMKDEQKWKDGTSRVLFFFDMEKLILAE